MRSQPNISRRRGVTLIELTVTITILAIVVSTVVATLASLSSRSAEVIVRSQAAAIGDAYLQMILNQPYANTLALVPTGLSDNGAKDQFGAPIPSLAGYSVTVTVISTTLPSAPAVPALRILISVTDPANHVVLTLVIAPIICRYSAMDKARHGHQISSYSRSGAFTLIEMVVVIVIVGILATMMAMLIEAPMNQYRQQKNLAEIQDFAANVQRMLIADVRAALPGSLRVTQVGTTYVIDMIKTLDQGFYHFADVPPDSVKEFNVPGVEGQFTTTGVLAKIAAPFPYTSANNYLIINNTGVPGTNAYQLIGNMTAPGTSITISPAVANEHTITFPATNFTTSSPTHRFYIATGEITYLCDTAAGTISRYAGHKITTAILSTNAALTAAGAAQSVLAASVVGCYAKASPGNGIRGGLLTFNATLQNAQGNQFGIFHQVPVEGVP